MTQENKELLLKDLSARIPYQPLCKKIDTKDDFCECDGPLGYSLRDLVGNNVIIKPYLRPMSSMTEEEAFEMFNVIYPNITPLTFEGLNDRIRFTGTNKEGDYLRIVLFFNKVYSLEQIDWLNANHFNYRLPPHLFIEAPEDMYKIK